MPPRSVQARIGESPSQTKTVPGGMHLTFEGPECSGKTTQIFRLRERLAAEGYRVVLAKQPGGTAVGAAIRSVILNPQLRQHMQVKTESLLYWADRYQIYEEIIRPALADGAIVLGDRDFDSSWTFQCFGRGIDAEWMARAQQLTIGDQKPDKTIVYLIPVQTILQRREARKARDVQAAQEHRIGEAEQSFHTSVIAGYEALMQREPNRFVAIDANASIEALHEKTYRLVSKLIAERMLSAHRR